MKTILQVFLVCLVTFTATAVYSQYPYNRISDMLLKLVPYDDYTEPEPYVICYSKRLTDDDKSYYNNSVNYHSGIYQKKYMTSDVWNCTSHPFYNYSSNKHWGAVKVVSQVYGIMQQHCLDDSQQYIAVSECESYDYSWGFEPLPDFCFVPFGTPIWTTGPTRGFYKISTIPKNHVMRYFVDIFTQCDDYMFGANKGVREYMSWQRDVYPYEYANLDTNESTSKHALPVNLTHMTLLDCQCCNGEEYGCESGEIFGTVN